MNKKTAAQIQILGIFTCHLFSMIRSNLQTYSRTDKDFDRGIDNLKPNLIILVLPSIILTTSLSMPFFNRIIANFVYLYSQKNKLLAGHKVKIKPSVIKNSLAIAFFLSLAITLSSQIIRIKNPTHVDLLCNVILNVTSLMSLLSSTYFAIELFIFTTLNTEKNKSPIKRIIKLNPELATTLLPNSEENFIPGEKLTYYGSNYTVTAGIDTSGKPY